MDIQVIYNCIDEFQYFSKIFEELAKWIIQELDLPVKSLNIIFTSDEHIQKLHNDFFNLDIKTDVITFNLDESSEEIESEIYISINQAKANSIEYDVPAHIEISRLIIHGCLHLAGFNDINNNDKKQMKLKEDEFVKEANFRFFN